MAAAAAKSGIEKLLYWKFILYFCRIGVPFTAHRFIAWGAQTAFDTKCHSILNSISCLGKQFWLRAYKTTALLYLAPDNAIKSRTDYFFEVNFNCEYFSYSQAQVSYIVMMKSKSPG